MAKAPDDRWKSDGIRACPSCGRLATRAATKAVWDANHSQTSTGEKERAEAGLG